jgi:hypothetical protein
MTSKRFTINGKRFTAEMLINGVLINPSQPKLFDCTPNEDRPESQAKWWNLPYIVTQAVESLDAMYANRTDEYAEAGRSHWVKGRINWMEAWPGGTRYETRCLDGGAWDRSTSWGMFATIEEAISCAKKGSR